MKKLFTPVLFLICLSMTSAYALRGETSWPFGRGGVIPDAPRIQIDDNGRASLVEQTHGGELTEMLNSPTFSLISNKDVARAILCVEKGIYCVGGTKVRILGTKTRSSYEHEVDILRAALHLSGRFNKEEKRRIREASEKLFDYLRENNLEQEWK